MSMCYLYRGISEEHYVRDEGRLIPAGKNSEILMSRADWSEGVDMRRDGTFERQPSEVNTVRAHHLKSGFRGGCYVSTTKDFQMAVFFATNGGKVNGYVFVIDSSKFSSFGIEAVEFPDPRYPDENEVSIRAADNGEIPSDVIVEILRV